MSDDAGGLKSLLGFELTEDNIAIFTICAFVWMFYWGFLFHNTDIIYQFLTNGRPFSEDVESSLRMTFYVFSVVGGLFAILGTMATLEVYGYVGE